MRIDIPMPQTGMTRIQLTSYLNTLRERIIYVSDLMGKIPPGGDYNGPYTFTPSGSTQTIAIAGKMASGDITINPIPSTYGRVTWNGSTLTIS